MTAPGRTSSGDMLLPDAAARNRIREDLDSTLIVEAAAGTGKTSELVRRLTAVLTTGRSTLDRLVAVTFTEKAAGEMKLRLRAGIERARTRSDNSSVRDRLDRALSELELARMGTIHGFCADLLRERPIEAEVDPSFQVLDDHGAHGLLAQAFDAWFERALSHPPEGVRRVLRRGAARASSNVRSALLAACKALAEHRDFDTPWSRASFDRNRTIDELMSSIDPLGSLAGNAQRSGDGLARNLSALDRFVKDVAMGERRRVRDYDALEHQLVNLAKDRKAART